MPDVVSDVIINYKSTGLEKVGQEIKQVSTSLDGLVVHAPDVEKSIASIDNSFKRLERTLGTAGGQAQKFAKDKATADRFLAQNPTEVERYNDAVAAMAVRHGQAATSAGKMAESTGLARHELINLGRQAQDVAVSLAGGQNPLTVLAQQGSQISDVFTASKASMSGVASQFKEIGASVLAFVTPARLAAGAMAAIGVEAVIAAHSWAQGEKEITEALVGIGRASGASMADVVRASATAANSTRTSFADARDGAAELLKSGVAYKETLTAMTTVTAKFAIATGTDTVDAAKKLAAVLQDPAKGAEELNKQYGFLNASTLQQIRNYQQLGDAQSAQLTLLKAFEPTLDKLQEKGGAWSRTLTRIMNAGSDVSSFIGATLSGGASDQERLANARSSRQQILDRPSMLGADDKQQLVEVVALNKAIAELEARINAASAAAASAKLDQLGVQIEGITRTIDPSIGKIEQLTAAYFKLKEAQDKGVSTPESEEAARSINTQIAALIGAQAEAERYGQRVAEIAIAYDGVSTSTALALQASENQRPVIEAIGAAAKMAAQYAADYANYMNKGKTETEAAALAADKLANAQAAAVAAAQQNTRAAAERNALEQAGYVSSYDGNRKLSDLEQARAARTATERQQRLAAEQEYNKVLRDTGDAREAQNAAYEVADSYTTKIASSTDRIKDAQRAAARSALEWQQNMLGVSAAAQQAAAAIDAAYEANYRAASGVKGMVAGGDTGSYKSEGAFSSQFGTSSPFSTGGGTVGTIPVFLTAKGPMAYNGNNPMVLEALQKEQNELLNLDPLNRQASNPIVKLQNSIESLTKSTDSLNSTNQDLLSPYYSQDPRTSHIGYRSQGMSITSSSYVAPAIANDNLTGTGPSVATTSSGGTTTTIAINMPITIQGGINRDEIGRTMYQTGQDLARRLTAVR